MSEAVELAVTLSAIDLEREVNPGVFLVVNRQNFWIVSDMACSHQQSGNPDRKCGVYTLGDRSVGASEMTHTEIRIAIALIITLACCGSATPQNKATSSNITAKAPKTNCPCTEHLTESQMSRQAGHVEMKPDVMGSHVNISGVVLLELEVEKNGRVRCATALSGNAVAITHLIEAVPDWRMKPYLKNGVAKPYCGRLRIKFSIVENVPVVEVVGGADR